MSRQAYISTALAASLVAFGASASAQYVQPGGAPYGQPVYGQPVYGAQPPPAPAYGATAPAVVAPPAPSRGRFSVGRFFLESLVGGVIGAGAGYGVLRLACGSDVCLGGALGALGTNIAVTPLAVWLLGMATGGEGSVGSAYLGGAIGLGAGGAGYAVSPGLSLAIGMTIMPFTSALLYELNSNGQAVAREHQQGVVVQSLRLSPLGGPGASLAGLSLDVGGRF